MKFATTFFALCLLALVMGCSDITVKHDYDKDAPFAALKTFDWLPMPTMAAGSVKAAMERNSLLDNRIKTAVNNQLAAKGYTQSAGNPDFLLMYHTGAQDKVDVTNWGYGYGRPYWGASHVDVYQYTQGTLILDIIDAKTKQLIWRGYAEGTIDPNASTEKREKRLNEAVTKILAKFPPA